MPPLPNEDGVEEDDSESGVADDVGEVDDESLLLLSIVVAVCTDGTVVAVPLECCCSFIRIHSGAGFAFSFVALFLETITEGSLIAFVFLGFLCFLFA